jgi:NCAIR mutase (PurE)-related protein
LNQSIQSVQEKLRNEETIHEELSEQIELLSFQLYLRKMKLINTLQITFQKIIFNENKMEEINARIEKYLIEKSQSLLHEDAEWMEQKATELEQLKIRWKDKLLQRDSNYEQQKLYLEK